MVCTDCIADFRFLLVLLREFHSKERMRKLRIFVGNLSDVMKQTGPLRSLCVQTKLRSHCSRNVSNLTGMLEKILTIRGTVLHTSDKLDELNVDAVDAEVNAGTFTYFENFLFELLLYLCHNLLDTCRMDASVDDELMESKTRNLTSHRIEGRKKDCVRGVVNDNLNSGSGLKSTDISSFTPDDASLDLIALDVEDSDRVLDCSFRGRSLDRVDYDSLSLLGRIQTGVVNHIVNVGLCLCPCLSLHVFHEYILGFGLRHSGNTLNLAICLFAKPIILGCLAVGNLDLRFEVIPYGIRLTLLALKFGSLLVQSVFLLLKAAFRLLNCGIALVHSLFMFAFELQELLLRLENLLLLYVLGLKFGLLDDFILTSFQDNTSDCNPSAERDCGTCECGQYIIKYHIINNKLCFIIMSIKNGRILAETTVSLKNPLVKLTENLIK